MTIEQEPAQSIKADLFVLDRCDVEEPGRRASAVRHVPASLELFNSHFPRMAVLPGVIVLGCLARVGERLLQDSFGGEWTLARAHRIRYRHFVQPGDELNLQVELIEHDGDVAVFAATASVAGKSVTTVRRMSLAKRGVSP